MTTVGVWLAVLTTVMALVGYELALALAQRRDPLRLARSAHATMREEWFTAVSHQPGSEILAVQTLRNSMMSATMIASTAALALMGTAALSVPSLHIGLHQANTDAFVIEPRTVLDLMLMTMLVASLLSSAMAVRYYNHAGYIGAMPVGSDARIRWLAVGIRYVRAAGTLYSWSLRHLILVVPIVAAIVYPLAGPIMAVALIAVLRRFDRVGAPVPSIE
jgi:hypothetical protein